MTTTSYNPLHGPDEEIPVVASLDLDGELELAHRVLDENATANIHDHQEMVQAATGLNYRLRSLLAAIEAERGESR